MRGLWQPQVLEALLLQTAAVGVWWCSLHVYVSLEKTGRVREAGSQSDGIPQGTGVTSGSDLQWRPFLYQARGQQGPPRAELSLSVRNPVGARVQAPWLPGCSELPPCSVLQDDTSQGWSVAVSVTVVGLEGQRESGGTGNKMQSSD